MGPFAGGDAALIVVLAALAGAVLGSFLAILVVRWPEGRGLGGRSMCDGCGRVLRPIELIPLIGYLATRGTCRTCGARIALIHPLMEFGCAALAAVAFLMLPWERAICVALASLILLTLSVLDLCHFWLPDRLTLPLGLMGLVASVSGPPQLLDRLTGATCGWVSLTVIAWAYQRVRGRAGLGAGDAKLFAAIGAWVGYQSMPFVLLGASILGLAVAVALLAGGRRVTASTRMPFGTLLGIAALPAIYWTALA